VPKGSPIKKKKPHGVAEVEAFKEVGLAGAAESARSDRFVRAGASSVWMCIC
jgi:hypothetical protein